MRCCLGALLLVLGALIAGRSALLLGGRGRPQRGPRPALVIAGPYRRTRNPLFAGVVLALVGLGVLVGSAAMVALALGASALLHVWVVLVEEPRLTARFGPVYEAYRCRVPRWWPSRVTADDDEGDAVADGR